MFSYRAGWTAGGVIGTIFGWLVTLIVVSALQNLLAAVYCGAIFYILIRRGEIEPRVFLLLIAMIIASFTGTGYSVYQYHVLHTLNHLPAKQVIMFSSLPPYIISGIVSAIFAHFAGAMDWLQVVQEIRNRK